MIEVQGIKLIDTAFRNAVVDLPMGAKIVAAYLDSISEQLKLAVLCTKSAQSTLERRTFVVVTSDQGIPLEGHEFVVALTGSPRDNGPLFAFLFEVTTSR